VEVHGDFTAGLGSIGEAQATVRQGKIGAELFCSAMEAQHRTEQIAVMVGERKAKVGQLDKIRILKDKIDELELEHMVTANEPKRKKLEEQINNLKAQHKRLERKSQRAIAKDGRIQRWEIEANRLNKTNHTREWLLATTHNADLKNRFSSNVIEGDKAASFWAQQAMGNDGAAMGGASMAGSSYVGQAFSNQ